MQRHLTLVDSYSEPLSHSEAQRYLSSRLIVAQVVTRPLQRAAKPHSRITSLRPGPGSHQTEDQDSPVQQGIEERNSHHGVSPSWVHLQSLLTPSDELNCACRVHLVHGPCHSHSFQPLGRNPLECWVSLRSPVGASEEGDRYPTVARGQSRALLTIERGCPL